MMDELIKELVETAHRFRGTAIVDDDFPEMLERFDLALARVDRELKAGGVVAQVVNGTLNDVAVEVASARQTHAPMNGHHEGYAVILDELWELCKMNTHKFGSEMAVREEQRKFKKAAMRKEAVQVAAMAIRFIEDVCDK